MQPFFSSLRKKPRDIATKGRFGLAVVVLPILLLGMTAASPGKQITDAKPAGEASPFPPGRVLKYAASSPQALRNIRNFVTFQLEVTEKHDVSHLDLVMAPTMLIHRTGFASLEEWMTGRAMDSKQVSRDFFRKDNAFENLKNHKRVIEEIYGIGDMVVARWRTEGVGIGPLFGVQAAGKPVLIHETGFIRFDDQGRMVEGSFTTDTAEYLHSLGVAPPTLP